MKDVVQMSPAEKLAAWPRAKPCVPRVRSEPRVPDATRARSHPLQAGIPFHHSAHAIGLKGEFRTRPGRRCTLHSIKPIRNTSRSRASDSLLTDRDGSIGVSPGLSFWLA